MIDTLQLNLVDYEINKDANLEIEPCRVNLRTGEQIGNYILFKNEDGNWIEGKKAYLNNEHFQFDIKSKGCFVKFSVPKILTNSNYYSIGKNGIRAALNKVEKELRENGINTNIYNSKLSRLDGFKNITTNEKFIDYAEIFSTLSMSRMNMRNYGTTFLYENGSQEICVYDKNEEMKFHRKELSSNGIDITTFPQNTMRIENRLKSHKKINSILEIGTASELTKHYDEMRELITKNVSKRLFKHSVDEIDTLVSSELKSQLLFYLQNFPKNVLLEFLSGYGLNNFNKHYSFNEVESIMREYYEQNGYASESIRVMLYKHRKKFHQKLIEYRMNKIVDKNVSLGTLYNEIKNKYLKAS